MKIMLLALVLGAGLWLLVKTFKILLEIVTGETLDDTIDDDDGF